MSKTYTAYEAAAAYNMDVDDYIEFVDSVKLKDKIVECKLSLIMKPNCKSEKVARGYTSLSNANKTAFIEAQFTKRCLQGGEELIAE